MRWTDVPIHFIDFEGSLASGVLEFGVVTLRGGAVVETQTRLCAATGRIAPEDQAVHGLDARAVEGHAPFSADFAYFAALRERGPLAAHYAQAENTLIKSAWAYPRASPDFSRPDRRATVVEWGPWIDTGRLCAELFSGLATGRLADLVTAFGVRDELAALAEKHCPAQRRNYHAALYDALAGALLLLALGRRPEFSEMTLPWILQMSTGDGEKRARLQQGELF